MNKKNKIFFGAILLVLALSFVSSVIVDVDYVVLYPGEEGMVNLEIENNENFDIEDISVGLDLSKIPFVAQGTSMKDVDDIDEEEDDSVSFTLRPHTNIVPGDYDIPYRIDYINAGEDTKNFTKSGSFGVRVSARTNLDFSAETENHAIVGNEGVVSLEIINRGLGEIKAVSVQIFPQGFELFSKDKIFVGTVDSEDSDAASFDVIYRSTNPVFSGKIIYKDFENKEQEEIVNIPLKVYTEEQALQLGWVEKSNSSLYVIGILVLITIWYTLRKINKRRRKFSLANRSNLKESDRR